MTHILQVKEGLVEVQKTLKMGDVAEFDSFMSAVIDNKAFDRISGYLQHAKSGPNTKVCIMYIRWRFVHLTFLAIDMLFLFIS